MTKIIVLKEEVSRMIAAGEVIERPLSVVKELVENSLDAGATQIRILLEKGGKELVCVQDNGEGFPALDAEIAFQRHSTSKLTDLADLDRLTSLGFRGEALPSILEVAQVELKTADNDSGKGIRLLFRDGALVERNDIAFSRGSSLEVRRLFFNFPVRRRFLKSDAAELQQIVQFLEVAALAHHGASFELIHNGRSLFLYHATQNLAERIYQVFGREFLDDLQEVSGDQPPYRLFGFVSKPNKGLPGKNRQYFVVNGRTVRERTLIAALNHTCTPFQEKNRFTAAIVLLCIPPSEVDVNIHPMKLEIRFRDSTRIYSFLRTTLESALSSGQIGQPASGPVPSMGQTRRSFAESFSTLQPSLTREIPLALFPSGEEQLGFRILGQYGFSYIIVEKGDELLVVDQHNARERVLFDRLRQQYREGEVAAASTLFPILVELSPGEKHSLSEERMSLLKKAGFDIADRGGTTVEIRTYPRLLEEKNVRDVFTGILGMEEDFWNEVDKVLANIACKAAIKVNQRLTPEEMSQIVRDLFASTNSHLCPHGRPIIVSLTLEEIEKRLKRK